MQYKKIFIISIIVVSILALLQLSGIIFMISVFGAGMAVVDGVAKTKTNLYVIITSFYYLLPFILLIVSLIVVYRKFSKYILHISITALVSAFIPILTISVYLILGYGLVETPDIWTIYPFLHIAFSVILFFILKFTIKKHTA